jgi:hypothetical protein
MSGCGLSKNWEMSTSGRAMSSAQDFVTRRIGDETIVVPLRNSIGDLGSIYTLNEPGAWIWQMVREELPVAQIAAAICREYEVSAEEATRDILALMDDLRDAGMMHRSTDHRG